MTLSSGLQADYAALIEKRNIASLRYTREADDWADRLLAVDPKCYDARVATGFSKYIIGSMAAPLRWVLRMGGVSGDKKQGIVELQMTADHGRYLGPFARILLAIAYVRDKDNARAREVLAICATSSPRTRCSRTKSPGWMPVTESCGRLRGPDRFRPSLPRANKARLEFADLSLKARICGASLRWTG